jgi:glutamate racemase
VKKEDMSAGGGSASGGKIGIFDSGLGGLIVAKAICRAMPEYDYVYLGDTKRVPYGNRSQQTVFNFTRQAADYLFRKENCAIIIIACNTASARALRKIQKEYTPSASSLSPLSRGRNKEGVRKVLGILIPAAEEGAKFNRVGVLGTLGTISSGTFPKEILKSFKKSRRTLLSGPRPKASVVFQNPAPMLVPLAEEGEKVLAKPFLLKYLKPLAGKKIDALILGCTHYPFFKNEIRKILARRSFSGGVVGNIKVISQDEIIPRKLKNYLARHPEISGKLSRNRTTKILVTDITENIKKLSQKWFGKKIKPQLIDL